MSSTASRPASPNSPAALWTPERREILRATVLENPFIPEHVLFGDGDRIKGLSPRQAEFLTDPRRDVLYGGAGGGGKSVALLLGAVQYATEPLSHALILRRTFAQLSKADSILFQAKEWWRSRPDVRYSDKEHTFYFPSGATVAFGHMDSAAAIFDYQGSGYSYIGYDELTQFKEDMFTYLFTRQRRRANSRVPTRMRAASNPGGIGHAWVKARYIDPKTRDPEAGFVPAKARDNPNLDQEDYRLSLAKTDALTRAQIEDGNWDAVEGGRFRADWFARRYHADGGFVVTPDGERFLPHNQPVFQTCDPSASASAAADHFVLSTWCVSPKANLVWLGCRRARLETPDQVAECRRLYAHWHAQFLAVEAVLNQRALAQILRRETDPVIVVREVSPRGQDKLTRAVGGINLASAGRVLLPQGPREFDEWFPLEEVLAELTVFTGEAGGEDDIVDTLSYSVELLPHLRGGPAEAPGAAFPGGGLRGGATAPAGGGGPAAAGRPAPPPTSRSGGPKPWGT